MDARDKAGHDEFVERELSRRYCGRSKVIQRCGAVLDDFVGSLLAMTCFDLARNLLFTFRLPSLHPRHLLEHRTDRGGVFGAVAALERLLRRSRSRRRTSASAL